ncbi:hypothetical protein VTK26DRAFT_6242 [Humicola hyalothermophila]
MGFDKASMDLHSLIRGALHATLAANASLDDSNSTGGGHSDLPDGILETLSPLLGFQFNPLLRLLMVLNNMIGGHLGFDLTYLLSALGFVWAIHKLWSYLYDNLYSLARQYFMASIEVSSSDDIYYHMIKWLARHKALVDSRSLTAETASRSAWEEEEEAALVTEHVSADGSGVYLNFSNQEAKAAPRFTPALGHHSFWFRGRYFRLVRKQESLFDGQGGWGAPQYKDKEILVISCFGRSPEPIKQLLKHAKEQFYNDHQAKTTVRRPAPQVIRRYGGRHNWQQVANRPVRPMNTVVLDDQQKIRVLSDMNEYLHPATPRWYANRGIPLRRGYLFYGPPGTGKTSLSFALAGVFGLDIYVISLLDPSLTEEDLLALFTSLPRRCVVLLEDIDSAGLRRASDADSSASSSSSSSDDDDDKGSGDRDSKDAKDKKTKKSRKSKKDWKVSDLARELKRQQHSDSSEKKGISLSGLLNAIDGVASHEGRVLIMTTNKPETLDEALIRPGRVDLQVAFSNATQEQARELFVRMYEPDSTGVTAPGGGSGAAEKKPVSPASPAKTSSASSPVPPLTPFSPPPTPFSTISGTTEVEDESAASVSPIPGPASPETSTSNPTDTTTTITPTSSPSKAASDPPSSTTISVPPPLDLNPIKPTTTNTNPDNKEEPEQQQQQQQQEKHESLSLHRHRHRQPHQEEQDLTPDELSALAAQFAAHIPGGVFSPAELQGFLLKRKKTPRRAVAEVGGWVAGMTALKGRGGKVLSVQ